MRYKEHPIPISELKTSAYQTVFNHFKIPYSERREARHYQFVKQSVSRLMEIKLSGRTIPIITKKSTTGLYSREKKDGIEIEDSSLHSKVSSVSELIRLGRKGYKANGYVPGQIEFVGYPNACYTDTKKLAFLNKKLARGQINLDTYEDLKSVLVIKPKEEREPSKKRIKFDNSNPFF